LIAGAGLDWKKFFPQPTSYVELPNYAWQRESLFHPVTPTSLHLLQRKKVHPLLGYLVKADDLLWENAIDTAIVPTLADHVVGDGVVFPGTGFAELALAAGNQWHAGATVELEELEIRAPLLLDDQQTKLVRVAIRAEDGSFVVQARPQSSEDAWTVHAAGRILSDANEAFAARAKAAALELPSRTADFLASEHDQLTRAVGLNYGESFQAVECGWVDGASSVWAKLSPPQTIADELAACVLHPSLLDCTFQLIIHLMRDQLQSHAGIAYVPTQIARLVARAAGKPPAFVRATLRRRSPHSITADFLLYDEQGELVAYVDQARFRSIRLKRAGADHLKFLDFHAVPRPLNVVRAPSDLAHALRGFGDRVAASVAQQGEIALYTSEVEPLLDALCSAFAREAVTKLAKDGALTNGAIARLVEQNPEGAPLLSWVLGSLTDDAVLVREPGGYRLTPKDDAVSAQDIWNSLIADHPGRAHLIHAAGRVGFNLSQLVCGAQPLSDLLPRECTYGSIVRHVLGGHARASIASEIRELLKHAVSKLGEGQRFGVLELSEGAPVFAQDLCAELDFARMDYAFASPVPASLDECRRYQERFPHLEMQAVPAVNDASAAGYHGEYALIVMVCDFTNEDHERASLDYARKHLLAGGKLLMLTSAPSRWVDFVFGGVRSWWPSQDTQSSSIQRDAAYWVQRVESIGFENAAVWPLDVDALATPHVLIADAPPRASSMISTDGMAGEVATPRTWIAVVDRVGDAHAFASRVAGVLADRGDSMMLIEVDATKLAEPDVGPVRGDPAWTARVVELCREKGAAGVLHLAGFNAVGEERGVAATLSAQEMRVQVAAAIARALEDARVAVPLWLVTSGALSGLLPGRSVASHALQDATLLGFARSMMNEAGSVPVQFVDMERGSSLDVMVAAIIAELRGADAESEVIFSAHGARYAPRLRIAPRRPAAPTARAGSATVKLGFQFPGQLRNLRWEETPHQPVGPGEIEIDVRATGLNFRDVMYALGLLSDEAVENGFAGPTLGLECAGVVTATGAEVREFSVGDSVVAFGPACFGNRVVTSADAASHVPSGLAFESAATIPGTFFTAYYALKHLAQLQEGERVLIHGAAGGVGIAAIQLAKWMGAEIFVTAGSDEKRDFVRLLGADHVFDSRSNDFADQVLRVTGGQGIDVVLNSLAGEAINRNLRVLKPFGRFLELGKRDFYENTKIGLRPFRNNISYFGIDADQLMSAQPALTRRLFREVMDLFSQGVLHALPYQTFEADDVVDAFRYMQQAKQIGKIVVTYANGITHVHETKRALPSLTLPAGATYLVTGGLGGFGLRTAEWLVQKGARNLVLISRSGPVGTEATAALAAFRAQGVRVHAAACDVTDDKALAALFALISTEMPPLRGVVHAAVVIDDGLVRNTTAAQIHKVFAPKVLGAQYLHRMTRNMKLDFFVLYSSATTLFGNPGQASYVAANSFLETLAELRRASGLPATCVRWGAIEDAGFLARNEAIKDALKGRMGGDAMLAAEALDVLEELMVTNRSGVGVMELDWRALNRFLPTAQSPKFRELAMLSSDADADEDHADDIQRLLAELSPDELLATFKQMLKDEIGEILRIPADKIDDSRSLYDMGLDSLMGVELGLAIESRFGIKLPVMALSESPTIAKLAEKLAALLKANVAPEDADANAVSAQVQQVVAQHAADVEPHAVEQFTKEIESGAARAGRMIH
jgi:phthiocerol/phenolphthiocerol synthesis type-I polyketide synthase C